MTTAEEQRTEWSIHDIARLAGTTSRTLRHYDAVGLLRPRRVGANGYRYYGTEQLVRLQRILMLRGLGLGLPRIAEVLAHGDDAPAALRAHLVRLRDERDRVTRQIAAVQKTITSLEGGGQLMAEEMLDGFAHTQYREEVERRWGAEAYAATDAWWTSLSRDDRGTWTEHERALTTDWIAAAARGAAPDGDDAQALARRHCDWLRGIPGTPGAGTAAPAKSYVEGLAAMYVADERFAAHYGGVANATFVRDALLVYADRSL